MCLLFIALCAPSYGQAVETTLNDQTDIAVTVYNNGLGLVRDTRNVSLSNGEVLLQFSDVAEKIRPETVGLKSTSAEGSVRILEQNYEYDLMSPAKLLEKYVGQDVSLVNFSEEIGFEVQPAKLLSANGGNIFEVDGDIFLGHPGYVRLPEVPENLIAKPSLIWTLDNHQADQTLEVTYMTNGISWKADYVVTLDRSDTKLDLAGWVTMNNQSGATYREAKLKLVAGDVNVAREPRALGFAGGAVMNAAAPMEEAMPQEEAFAEYHLYTMPRRSTIKNNQSKQLRLLDGSGVACEKVYEFRGQRGWFFSQVGPMRDVHIAVFLEFENEEDNGLGIPLPGGVMRIYQEDSESMLQFAGEDRVDHTPKDETVRLRMGEAFDVVADRVQTDFKIIADNLYESAYEVHLRNHKEEDIVIDVIEPMTRDWEVLSNSHDFEKLSASTIKFPIPVAAGGDVKLTYRVRVRTF
jgi:hypothetical protein